MSQPMVMFSTCSSETKAEEIATLLIEQRLAACVNILPGIKSVFRWDEKINVESECLLVIKSQQDHVPSVKQVLIELSGYELPELIAVEIVDGSPHYLDWLIAETRAVATEPTSE